MARNKKTSRRMSRGLSLIYLRHIGRIQLSNLLILASIFILRAMSRVPGIVPSISMEMPQSRFAVPLFFLATAHFPRMRMNNVCKEIRSASHPNILPNR